jgi:DNA-binding MarR family transcriptional regulator
MVGMSSGEEDMRSLVQQFARGFGFLRSAQTPCGKPLPLSHAHALMFLLERDRRRTLQRDLQEALGIDKSNVARLCRKMRTMGHVKIVVSKDDARARELELTDKGLQVARDVEQASRERFRKLTRSVPSSERPRVISALRTLVAATAKLSLVIALGCRSEPTAKPSVAPELDTRTSVPLLPMMAHHQKQNMRDHLLAVQEVIAAAAVSDFVAAEKSAQRLGSSPMMKQMCTHMGQGAPGFTAKALAFHDEADSIATAARLKDGAALLSALGRTLGHCTGCHAQFKQKVVDEASWAALTGSPPPTHAASAP